MSEVYNNKCALNWIAISFCVVGPCPFAVTTAEQVMGRSVALVEQLGSARYRIRVRMQQSLFVEICSRFG